MQELYRDPGEMPDQERGTLNIHPAEVVYVPMRNDLDVTL